MANWGVALPMYASAPSFFCCLRFLSNVVCCSGMENIFTLKMAYIGTSMCVCVCVVESAIFSAVWAMHKWGEHEPPLYTIHVFAYHIPYCMANDSYVIARSVCTIMPPSSRSLPRTNSTIYRIPQTGRRARGISLFDYAHSLYEGISRSQWHSYTNISMNDHCGSPI